MAVRAMGVEGPTRQQGGLGEEPWNAAAMRLRRVHQERVAEIDGPRAARGERFGQVRGFAKFFARQLAQREATVSMRREATCDFDVRADAEARGRVVVTDVGEEEEHQEGSAFGCDIGAPFEKVRLVLPTEARIDVPSAIPRFFGRWEANGERSEAYAGQPAIDADERIEGGEELRGIRSRSKGRCGELAEANDGLGPGRRRVGRTTRCEPQDGATCVGDVAGEGVVDTDIAFMDELFDLRF
ncbi:MAG TPA: hypothetical protein VM694_31855 [Polyangium sp.]|nr:hypothetical protein [Polyangium sp.]